MIGFDDLPLAAFDNLPLTTVHQLIKELSTTAVTLLLDQIKDRRPAAPVRLPAHLVVRSSCSTPVSHVGKKGG
jgi:DNA-binding LacI/PurR family transcriptional regulator